MMIYFIVVRLFTLIRERERQTEREGGRETYIEIERD